MQGILDFERKHGVPTGWVNYAIRYSSPRGYWQRLERGEIKMAAEFFKGFTADLHNQDAWRDFQTNSRNEKKMLKDMANPTQLGDHVSLKAEAADSRPTENDLGAQSLDSLEPQQNDDSEMPSLSKLARDTTIGDPISLESEAVVEPSKSALNIYPQLLNKTPAPSSPLSRPEHALPSIPEIDGESLFWIMMGASRHTDPYTFPALQRLSKQSPRPILAALSNTVIYPPGHPWSKQDRSATTLESSNAFSFNPRDYFDLFIASAEVGMRKPSREIYELTLERVNDLDKQKGGQGVKAEDIVFLDDIGENLKTGRELGMRTIKVQLGKTWRAVKELESMLGPGVELLDDKTRRSKL